MAVLALNAPSWAEEGETSSSSLRYFDQAVEFPHPLLPARFRGMSYSQLKSLPETDAKELRAHVDRMRALLEKAMGSEFRRLALPIVAKGDAHAKQTLYFPYVNSQIAPVDPTAKIMPSGGVVRTGLGWNINQIYAGLQKGISAEQTLQDQADSKEVIPALSFRGVGSDFDIWLRCQDAHFKTVQELVHDITLSAEAHYGFANDRSGMKKSIFPIPDAKSYDKQIAWAVSEGGSTLDFLSFDVENDKFVEPPEHPHIVEDFILGFFDYVAPRDANLLPDPLKQLVRGFRPFLELPSLRLKDDTRMREEIAAWRKALSEKATPSAKVYEQFPKMVRNSSYSGAHNRFFRSAPGTLDAQVTELIQQMEKKSGARLFPEYLDHFPLEQIAERAKTMPKKLADAIERVGGWIEIDEFIQKHTDNGVIHHGSPQLEFGIAILRQGLFISGGGQGRYLFGRGTYSSKDRATATAYAGASGVVLDLPIRRDARIRTLNWPKVSHLSEVEEFVRECMKNREEPFMVLARDYGVSNILNEHNLLQNSAIIDFRNPFQMLVEAYRNAIFDKTKSASARLFAHDVYSRLYGFALSMDSKEVAPPPDRAALVAEVSNWDLLVQNARAEYEREQHRAQRAWARYQEAVSDYERWEIYAEWKQHDYSKNLFSGRDVARETPFAGYASDFRSEPAADVLQGLAEGRYTAYPDGATGQLWLTIGTRMAEVSRSVWHKGLTDDERAIFERRVTDALVLGLEHLGPEFFSRATDTYEQEHLVTCLTSEFIEQEAVRGRLLELFEGPKSESLPFRFWFYNQVLATSDREAWIASHPKVEQKLQSDLIWILEVGHMPWFADEDKEFKTGWNGIDLLDRLLKTPYFKTRFPGGKDEFLRGEFQSGDDTRIERARTFVVRELEYQKHHVHGGSKEPLLSAELQDFAKRAWHAKVDRELRADVPVERVMKAFKLLIQPPTGQEYGAEMHAHRKQYVERLTSLLKHENPQVAAAAFVFLKDCVKVEAQNLKLLQKREWVQAERLPEPFQSAERALQTYIRAFIENPRVDTSLDLVALPKLDAGTGGRGPFDTFMADAMKLYHWPEVLDDTQERESVAYARKVLSGLRGAKGLTPRQISGWHNELYSVAYRLNRKFVKEEQWGTDKAPAPEPPPMQPDTRALFVDLLELPEDGLRSLLAGTLTVDPQLEATYLPRLLAFVREPEPAKHEDPPTSEMEKQQREYRRGSEAKIAAYRLLLRLSHDFPQIRPELLKILQGSEFYQGAMVWRAFESYTRDGGPDASVVLARELGFRSRERASSALALALRGAIPRNLEQRTLRVSHMEHFVAFLEQIAPASEGFDANMENRIVELLRMTERRGMESEYSSYGYEAIRQSEVFYEALVRYLGGAPKLLPSTVRYLASRITVAEKREGFILPDERESRRMADFYEILSETVTGKKKKVKPTSHSQLERAELILSIVQPYVASDPALQLILARAKENPRAGVKESPMAADIPSCKAALGKLGKPT